MFLKTASAFTRKKVPEPRGNGCRPREHSGWSKLKYDLIPDHCGMSVRLQ